MTTFKKATDMLTEIINKYSKEAEMNKDSAKPDYEQLLEAYEFKIDELNKQIKELQEKNEFKTDRIARLEGYAKGLEFAIRCNGVSGAEVKL